MKKSSNIQGFWLVWGKWIRAWKNVTFWSQYYVVENKIYTPNKYSYMFY